MLDESWNVLFCEPSVRPDRNSNEVLLKCGSYIFHWRVCCACIASSSVHTPGVDAPSAGLYGLYAVNGVKVLVTTLPLGVIAKALLLLSMIVGL